MTGSSVEEDRMVAERLLAEQLMDLPRLGISWTVPAPAGMEGRPIELRSKEGAFP